MAKTSLEKAREAYSKNKNTKYTWKDGKKSVKKKPKKKKKEVASHYGQVEKKTQTAGKQGAENRRESRKQSINTAKKAGSTFKKNVSINKTTNKPTDTSKPKQYKGASRTGTKVTPMQVTAVGNKKRAADARGGLKSTINTVKTGINPRTVGGGAFVTDTTKPKASTHYGQVAKNTITYGKEGEKNRKKFQNTLRYNYNDDNTKDFLGEDATAKGTAAGKAYNRSKTGKYNQYKEGERTVTVDTEKEKEENATAIYKSSTKSEKNAYGQLYNAYYKRLSDEYDKVVKEYGEDAVRREFGSKDEYIESSLGKKDDFIKDNLDAGKEDRIKSANEQAEKESKYTYSKAPVSTNDFEIQRNASLLQNNKVTTKTDKDRYVTDKDGNIKYDITFDEDGKPVIKPKKKKGKETVETTQGANIIDYYAGGFNKKGELTSQRGSQKVADTRAGAIHDAPFFTGMLQGSSYGDITKGLGQYSRAAGKSVDKTKESKAFLGGYMVGQGTQFMMGGTAKMTDALVKGIGRKGLERSVKNIGLRKGAADILFEAPINTLDAAKMATDSNGNFNKKAFLGYMALNSGLSGGIGSIIGGVGAKMTKSQAQDFLRLSIKAESGVGLTEAEAVKLGQIQKKFEQMRQSGNVANADIANKAEYDAVVAAKVFDNGGTAEEAYKLINNTSTNVEKMNMSASIKENADIQFELLRAERDNIIEQMAKASPEERAVLGRQAAELRTEMNRLGEIANTAESNLAIAKRQNRTSLRDLTNSLENMSKRTGIQYEVLDDMSMRRVVADTMARKADELEAALKAGEIPEEGIAAVEARIKEYRQGVPDDRFYKGFYYKDENGETRILINSDSPQAYQTVVGHETGHLIKKASEEEFYALGDQLEKFAREFGDYDAVVEDITRSYPTATSAEIREEVICELLGRYVYGANDKVLKRIAGEKPSLLTRIVDYFKELLSKTTDRVAAKELTAIIDKIDTLTEDVGVKLTKDGKVKEGTYSVDDNIPAKELDESGAIVEKNGSPVAQYDKDGSFKASVSTYEKSGRDELKKYVNNLVKDGEMAEDEAKQLLDEVEDMYKICKEYADSGKYEPFSTWSMAKVVVGDDGKPVFTSVRKNAEYPMNLDFSTICKKRRTLDAVFNELIDRGVMDRLDLTALGDMKFMAAANDTIRKYGFEAACEICFVEARRYRQRGTAKQFAEMYNQLVDSMTPDKSKISYFNYGKDSTVSEVADGIHTLDNSAVDTSYLERAIEEEKNKAIQNLEKKLKKPSTTKEDAAKFRQSIADIKSGEKQVKTVRADTARFLMENPSQRRRIQIGDLMSSNGFEGMAVQNPELMKLYNRKKGTGGAKATFGDVQYMNEIINSKTFDRDAAYAVAGVRAQSFSDYVPRMVFDYIQMIGDLAAKRLPMHVYTKEPLFVKQFGLTGAKINMSLIPDYDPHGVAAGLDANGNYLWNEEGTFPYDEAVKLQNAEGYKDNVGTIAVGVSDAHIEAMLKDPNIQMIIPYHKSSLNKRIAKMRNVDKFKDYTKVQETKVAYGSTKSVEKDFPFNEELYKLSHGEDGKLLPREEWGDPRELANRYLAWCEGNGYQPKFPKFKDNPNYYKLLEDFGLYDKDGNFKPQHDVQARFPTADDVKTISDNDDGYFKDMTNLIKDGLEEDAILEGNRKHDVPKITDEIIENAKKNGWLDDDFKASAAGVKAQGADTDASNLALELKKGGLSNTEIKDITGWYIAQDGKPRFQFSDSGFKIKDAVYADYHPEKATSDRAIITASEKRDDAMRDFYHAAQDADPRGQGAFDIMLKGASDGKTIGEVRKELQAAAKEGKIPKETATVDTDLATKYTKYVKSEQKFSAKSRGTASPTAERLANVIDHDELFKYYPQAKDIRVEFVDKIKGGGTGQFSARTNTIQVVRGRSKDEMEDTLIHEIQHWIQREENHGSGASVAYWENVKNNIDALLGKTYRKLSHEQYMEVINAGSPKEAGKIVQKYLGRERGRLYARLEEADERLSKVISGKEDPEFEAYWSTLGEREARDAEAKRNKTQKEIDNSDAPLYAEQGTLVREDFDQFSGDFDDFKFSQGAKESPLKNAESAKAEAEKKIASLKAERETATGTSAKIANKQRNTSKYSNASDKSEKLKELKAQRAESDAKIAEIDKQIKDANKELAKAQKVIDENADRLAKGRKAKTAAKVDRLRSEIEGLESDIRAKEAEIKKMDGMNLDGKPLSEIDKHLDARNKLVHEVEELQSRIEARTDEISKSTLLKSQREALEKPATPKPKETPKAETPKAEAPKVEEPAVTPAAAKPEVPTSQTKTKAAKFRDTDEYKTFTETPNSYASARLKEMTEAAMNYDVDVAPRIAEFNELNKEIRSLKGQRRNSKTPSHIADFDRQIEEAEVRQTAIARSVYKDVAEKRVGVVDGKITTSPTWRPKDIDATTAKEVSAAIESVGGVKGLAESIKPSRVDNVGSKKANKVVTEEMKNYSDCLNKFLKGDNDPDLQNARAYQLLDNISERLKANPEDADAVTDLMNVVNKMGEDSSLSSSARSAAKILATSTPKGRLGVALNAVDNLNARYGDKIDGVLELTEEEKINLATATGDELEDLFEQINNRLWENIPASRMEQFNEIRHMFMLTNIRTHARNMTGNLSFRGVRSISDEVENMLQSKVFRGAIEKRGGEVDRVHVKKADIRENEQYLTDEFHAIYDKSDSKTRWKETSRPDGVPVVKIKALNWLIQMDYKALEKEDMITFVPAFQKSYMQYVNSKGWDIKAMTDAQKKTARERALFDAEYATFRDNSVLSERLVGLKHTLATKEGKTFLGTGFYRLGNAALEGVIPFVKTPVNIFRRSVDFSPISLLRCVAELTSKDVDTFKAGIHHLSTGLTGTGIFAIGYALANNDYISIETQLGSHSGSRYYDQDMGYQDYSLEINIGGVHQSWTIDWLQPTQASLFMGAAFHKTVDDMLNGDIDLGTNAISALFAVTSPMLDASFMSSTKDMIETFQRRAGQETNEGEPNMRGAITQMLLGDLPKNYVSSIVPQVVSQAANVVDPYKRDTRSTLKDPLLASWDTAGKQIINKIPVFRNLALNPKLDRWGNDVSTGRNVATRLFFCMMNPSNVKTINENKYDRELFRLRNTLEKGSKAYKNFFYNFTGNPNLELAVEYRGRKRMTYDELYTYGQANRIEQTERIHAMMDSDMYKDMTDAMKVAEVDDAHWIGNMVAGHDVYGVNYALKSMLKSLDPNVSGNSRDSTDAKLYMRYKDNAGKGGVDKEKFWTWRVDKERLYARAHPSGDDGYRIKGLCAIESGDQNLIDSVQLTGNKEVELTHMWENILGDVKGLKGKKKIDKAKEIAFNNVSEFCCRSTSNLKNAKVESDSLGMISAAAGLSAFNGHKSDENTYRGMGHFWNSAQAGGGLQLKYNKNGKYDLDKLEAYKNTIDSRIEKRPEGTTEKEVVMDFIENDLGITNADEAACVYQTIYLNGYSNPNSKTARKNPYKEEINDHLEWGENKDDEWYENAKKGGGGWGRRGRRGGWGHGGGGGGGGTAFTPVVNTAGGAAKQTITKGKFTRSTVSDVTRPSDYTKPSNLNDAYRKRARKMREASRRKA